MHDSVFGCVVEMKGKVCAETGMMRAEKRYYEGKLCWSKKRRTRVSKRRNLGGDVVLAEY